MEEEKTKQTKHTQKEVNASLPLLQNLGFSDVNFDKFTNFFLLAVLRSQTFCLNFSIKFINSLMNRE